jgi:hypothetical protein
MLWKWTKWYLASRVIASYDRVSWMSIKLQEDVARNMRTLEHLLLHFLCKTSKSFWHNKRLKILDKYTHLFVFSLVNLYSKEEKYVYV